MCLDLLQNWLNLGYRLFIFLLLGDNYTSETGQISFFGHFHENAREEWPKILHADVAWQPSEIIRFWSWSVDIPLFGTIF